MAAVGTSQWITEKGTKTRGRSERTQRRSTEDYFEDTRILPAIVPGGDVSLPSVPAGNQYK